MELNLKNVKKKDIKYMSKSKKGVLIKHYLLKNKMKIIKVKAA